LVQSLLELLVYLEVLEVLEVLMPLELQPRLALLEVLLVQSLLVHP
jgi:hypothetical protein